VFKVIYFVKIKIIFLKSLKEQKILGSMGSWSVVRVQTVNVDPLEGSEWRNKFTEVDSSTGSDPELGWLDHGWGLDHDISLVAVLVLLDLVPDPLWSVVVWASVVSDGHLLSDRVISGNSVSIGVLESPVESGLVDLSTSVSNFVGLVEVDIGLSRSLQDGLSGEELCLVVDGRNLVSSSVEFVVLGIEILSHREDLNGALLSSVLLAFVVDLWVVVWEQTVGSVEVVLGFEGDEGVIPVGVVSHHFVSSDNPGGSCKASWKVVVLHGGVVASWLHVVASL